MHVSKSSRVPLLAVGTLENAALHWTFAALDSRAAMFSWADSLFMADICKLVPLVKPATASPCCLAISLLTQLHSCVRCSSPAGMGRLERAFAKSLA